MSFDQDVVERASDAARERAKDARCGVGAGFIGNVDEGDDGWRGMVAVSDGDRVIEMLVAVGAPVPLGPGSVRSAIVADLVEEMACDFDSTDRLGAMQSAKSGGPGLRLDDRFPTGWRDAFD
jgi:hypothetical protein